MFLFFFTVNHVWSIICMNNCICTFIFTMESINPSMSIASTSEVFPEVYIVDNEAEPYWLIMMVEFFISIII